MCSFGRKWVAPSRLSIDTGAKQSCKHSQERTTRNIPAVSVHAGSSSTGNLTDGSKYEILLTSKPDPFRKGVLLNIFCNGTVYCPVRAMEQ